MVLMLLLFLVESLENSLFHQFWIAAVNICSESMAGFRLSRSTGITTCSRWKQWWRRSPNTCCSKKILLLLMWNMLFSFSWYVVTFSVDSNILMVNSSVLFSYSLAPLVGWLADVRFGRYEVLRFGPWAALLASILYYFAMITEGSDSTLSNVLMTVAIIIAS